MHHFEWFIFLTWSLKLRFELSLQLWNIFKWNSFLTFYSKKKISFQDTDVKECEANSISLGKVSFVALTSHLFLSRQVMSVRETVTSSNNRHNWWVQFQSWPQKPAHNPNLMMEKVVVGKPLFFSRCLWTVIIICNHPYPSI